MPPKEEGHANKSRVLHSHFCIAVYVCLICGCNCRADPNFGFVRFFLEVKLFMKCGEDTKNISGPISVTDISKFTGDTHEDSVVSDPVCQPNITETGVGERSLFWQFEGTDIPRVTRGEGNHSGWIAVIYADKRKPSLALQTFHSKQAKEGIFTCFYVPDRGRNVSVSVGIYFPSE